MINWPPGPKDFKQALSKWRCQHTSTSLFAALQSTFDDRIPVKDDNHVSIPDDQIQWLQLPHNLIQRLPDNRHRIPE